MSVGLYFLFSGPPVSSVSVLSAHLCICGRRYLCSGCILSVSSSRLTQFFWLSSGWPSTFVSFSSPDCTVRVSTLSLFWLSSPTISSVSVFFNVCLWLLLMEDSLFRLTSGWTFVSVSYPIIVEDSLPLHTPRSKRSHFQTFGHSWLDINTQADIQIPGTLKGVIKIFLNRWPPFIWHYMVLD